MQSKMMQLQREIQDKTLGVLTPEQTKKLKELSGKDLSNPGQKSN
jgi:Spy/CpxP family protein refolding chaperone